jgi:hypothetical protein
LCIQHPLWKIIWKIVNSAGAECQFLGGPAGEKLLAPFEAAFASADPAKGGCPTVAPPPPLL